MNIRLQKVAAAMMMAAAVPAVAHATGWPANYEGVMLQGFYWDSYADTKWTKLESQADELSKYFKLIWIPNSGNCGSGNNMGYMPQYWFTNHNSSFGTEAELMSMIQTYKAKGTGFIADVVINHRNGVTSWTDFPKEEWNGQTWFIGTDGICRNDECNSNGFPTTGAYDTGDNFDGCRDLDHTNANVQNNCKNYVKCLLEKYGYVGTRYDMVKGYGGQYNKIYNQYAGVQYSVGEYWDSSYDAVAAWIEATGKESAAFDFPGKYAINKAFSNNDMTELVWKANGTTPQPAGMIHFGYPQYAVTFVDNHDTYRDGSKFNGNVVAANAFILLSPGTPCVFLPHYQQNKAAIQKLIDIRNTYGIHNLSKVTVLQTSKNCYMAEVIGTKGKVVVKIGSAMVSPSGYSDSDIKTSGTDYCVWVKSEGGQGGGQGGNDDDVTMPTQLYVMGNLAQGSWETNVGVKMTKEGDLFVAKNVELKAVSGETKAFFTFVTALGTTGENTEWDGVINASDRYGATTKDAPLSDTAPMKKFAVGVDASSAYSWSVTPGTYTITADFKNMKVALGDYDPGNVGGNDDDEETDPTMPAKFYLIGEHDGNTWAPHIGKEMTKVGNEFHADIELTPSNSTNEHAYYSFAKSLASTQGDWNTMNASGNRYAPASDTFVALEGEPVSLTESPNPSDAKAYYSPKGKVKVIVNWKNKTVSVKNNVENGIETVDTADADAPVRWFNLQGQEVASPERGIYIRVQGRTTRKVML